MKKKKRAVWEKHGKAFALAVLGGLVFLAAAIPMRMGIWNKRNPQWQQAKTTIGETINYPLAPLELTNTMKTRGCVFDGLLTGYGESFPQKIAMLKRTECKFLHRAIETWNKPPDFPAIRRKIQEIKSKTGKDFIYGLFIAESVDINSRYYFPEEKRYFNFDAMCAPGTFGAWGKDTCRPSFSRLEYRKYLRYITRQAIDLGIQEITFGQIYYQDPKWETNPQARQVVAEVKQYASSRGKSIAVGAQTNTIEKGDYLKNFDFITGGIGQDENGFIENAGPCWSFYQKRSGYCWAMLWNKKYRASANNILVYLDWNNSYTDDMNRFVRMPQEKRWKFLGRAYDFFLWRNVGFLFPLNAVLDKSGQGCYGATPEFYSASQAFSCKDEIIINAILRGEGTLPYQARFVSQKIPSKMIAGKEYLAEVIMENTSFRQWSAKEGIKLKLRAKGDAVKQWFPVEITLAAGEEIKTRQEKKFSFKLKAPLRPGSYLLSWQLFEPKEGYFGEPTAPQMVLVSRVNQ